MARTSELDFDAFSADEWVLDAVLHNLTVIGEAARHLPDSFCDSHPEIPWLLMRDMRNLVVHEYFGIDLTVIWTTIREDLPPLAAKMRRILESPSESIEKED